ncbi:tail protein [Bordetella phage vB_BbrM_PHB04]|uniref:Tail protein n=1 Tax=Bordetella phage vB_BbrM_PHB04 TaxID=2029657 RepID=A0A291LA09_9CAUD|nr:tail fiber protein [Bordetella phage vB_BbrM_PHB04]ATI15739.1 tail protein [Bordetella phage vB_BbrM_PHB04]
MAYLGNSPLNTLFSFAPVTLAQGQTEVLVNYTPGRCLFFKNGALLEPNVDYIATNGSTVTLANPASAGDMLIGINLASFAVANALPLSGGVLSGPASMPTPAQFDDSTTLATTEFVKRAGVAFSRMEILSGSQALTASQAGRYLYGTNTGAYTWTLPSLSTVPDGAVFHLKSATVTATLTVQAAAGDGIFGTTSAITSFQIAGTGDAVLVAKPGTGWILASGTALAQFAGVFGALFNANNGYQKLPSGVILQCGVFNESGTPLAPNSNVSRSITFPLAFPNAAQQVIVGTTLNFCIAAAGVSTQTGFTVHFSSSRNPGDGNLNLGCTYLAIGN